MGNCGCRLTPGYFGVPYSKTTAIVNWVDPEPPLECATKGIAATKTD
jgi:hypothetical protein